MKRLLILVAVLAAVVAPAQQGAPSDVPRNHWAFPAVDELFRAGILQGYPSGSFYGSRPATRFELSSMLAAVNASLSVLQAPAVPPFQSGMSDLQKALADLRLNMASVGADVSELKGTMGDLRQELSGLRSKLDEMRKQLNGG